VGEWDVESRVLMYAMLYWYEKVRERVYEQLCLNFLTINDDPKLSGPSICDIPSGKPGVGSNSSDVWKPACQTIVRIDNGPTIQRLLQVLLLPIRCPPGQNDVPG
jgi:hypothetical protein